MNRFPPSRIAIATLVVLTFFTCVARVKPTDIPGGSLAQEQPRVFRVPFREVNHRILINMEVDDTPATFLFDTGARVSVLFKPTGYDCRLRLGYHTHGKFVLACDGSSPGVAFIVPESEVRFNGLLGADLMSKFASVRIDYSHHLIELEE